MARCAIGLTAHQMRLRVRRRACEVQVVSIFHGVMWIRRLSCLIAPRAKCLICLLSCATRPPRTSRLLSCHRSGGSLLLAVPARPFAKLRSDKNQTKRPGAGFRAGSLQSICRVFGGPHARHVSQIDRSQDAGAVTAVSDLCRWGAGRRRAGAYDDCGPHSDLMVAAHTIDVQRPAELPRGPLRVIPATRTMFVVGGELIRPRSRLSSWPVSAPESKRSGVKRTCRGHGQTDANDPVRKVSRCRLSRR
jgi:hypothetical protein